MKPIFNSLILILSCTFLLCTTGCSEIGIKQVAGLSSFGGFGSQEGVLAKPLYHVISKGESLLGISGKYQATPDEILMLNGLQTTKHFRVGQRLLVGYRYPDDDILNNNEVKIQRASISEDAASSYNTLSNKGNTNTPNSKTTEIMLRGGRILWPLEKSARIVSGFGPRWGTFHDGLDFAAPTGTKVLAAHSGVVAYAGSDLGGYGKLLVIKGDDGLISVYAHNSKLIASQGDRISRGQYISQVGSSGKAEGPHLHFEVRTRDKRGKAVAVDPLPLLKGDVDNKPRYRINDSLQPLLAWLE